MNKRYVCPKCRCGCLFEDKGKLICMNCDAVVRKASARGVRHEHVHQTYTVSMTDRPVTVSVEAGQTLKPVKKSGCGLWIFLILLFFWLLPTLIGFFSYLF